MEELKRKIVALIDMMDGKRDLDFICLAFQEVPRGDVAIAVLELCLDGRLVIDENGISLPREAEVAYGAPSEAAAEVEAAEPIETVESVEMPSCQEELTEADRGSSVAAPASPAPEEFEAEPVPGVEYLPSVIRATDSVEVLNLSTRPSNCLSRLGITTVAQLVRALPGLAAQQGVGPGSVAEIGRVLAARAASFSSPLGTRTADELRYVSGCTEYVFDALGVLVSLPAQSVSGGRECSEQTHSVEELGLGDAINRRLRVNGISSVEDLLRMSPATLAAVPRLGYGTVGRIRTAVTAFCSRFSLDAGAWGDGLVCEANVARLIEAGGSDLLAVVEGIESACTKRMYPVHERSLRVLAAEFAWWKLGRGAAPDEVVDGFLRMVASSDALASICKSALEDRCRQALGEDCSSLVSVPAVEPWQGVAAGMTSVDGIRTQYDAESGMIRFELDDVSEWLDGLQNERDARLVRQRLEGKTLQEIGESEGVTRERVRQVVDTVLAEARPLKEELWRGLFEAYDLTFAQFAAITGLGRPSYGYLTLTAETKKAERAPLVTALDDAEVSDEIKDVIRNGNILTDSVFDDGELVRANKADIIRHLLLRRENGQAFTLEEIYDSYRAFLANHGLEESGRLDPTGMRAFGTLIDRMPFVMYAKAPADETGERRGIRYYDSGGKDFSPLVTALARLAVGADIEISAEALMDEPSLADALVSLDIRNGYELHQVLCAWCADIPGVRLGRAPMMTLGTGDRRRQVLELISEIGPADANALAEEYAARYGVRPASFKANYLDGLEQYCHDGLYSYEAAALDEGQLATLRSILIPVQSWCPAAMVREKFLSCYPSWAGELITAENMEKVGFSICDGLLVREGFDLRAAFAGMIADAPSFRLGEGGFTEDVCSSGIFVSELNKAVRHFEVLEVRKGEYLSVEAFAAGAVPMTPESFSTFVDGVIARMVPGRPYSVKSLRALGLMDELDAVAAAQGLGDFFEESVLSLGYVGGALKRTSVAFTSLFARTAGVFSVSDAIEWYVRRRGSLTVQQIVDILAAEHGAVANLTNMRFAVQRSSLAFDAERDMAVLPEGAELLEEGPALLPVEEVPEAEEGTGPEEVSDPEETSEPEEVALNESAPNEPAVSEGEPSSFEQVEAVEDIAAPAGASEPAGDVETSVEMPVLAAFVATAPFRGSIVAEGGLVISAEADDAGEEAAGPKLEIELETESEPEAALALESAPADDAQDELKSEIALLEAELARKMAALEEKERLREECRSLSRRIPELEAEARSYGFFQRAERRAAQARLDEARARLESLKGEGSGMGLIRRETGELQDKLTELKARLVNQ